MSEYWKSTPKYWCKHCKTYVRDTKLERTNHDATPKHQGNLKRFLRDLHRGHEQGEKDKERAKAEVARLNGMGTAGGSASSSSSGLGRGPTPAAPKPQATAADRKRQLQQLAELGVSIPDEFRPDMAMAGEWQVTSRRIIEEGDEEKKPDAIALGVRKRQVEEEEEEEAVEARKRRWGQTHRTYPSEKGEGDLDALLSNVTRKGKELATKTEADTEVKTEVKTETATEALPSSNTEVKGEEQLPTAIKREAPDRDNATAAIPPDVKQEGEEPVTAGIVFKKRKAKNIRQK
ncbi:related to formin binding protein [Phialocephala subalpina]|uniref:Related to formin binding protein n=1 Tax=Phialocephala subalpina TaxID=576137 RepID=A0A1L7X7N7_9HELO|nr:related to formin binding protein [Phialocephala subalpina]